mgnify:CR=1 FL=1
MVKDVVFTGTRLPDNARRTNDRTSALMKDLTPTLSAPSAPADGGLPGIATIDDLESALARRTFAAFSRPGSAGRRGPTRRIRRVRPRAVRPAFQRRSLKGFPSFASGSTPSRGSARAIRGRTARASGSSSRSPTGRRSSRCSCRGGACASRRRWAAPSGASSA